MLLVETGKETLRLVESGEHHFVYRDGKLLVEVVVLWQVSHGDFLHRLAVLIVVDVSLGGVHQSEIRLMRVVFPPPLGPIIPR